MYMQIGPAERRVILQKALRRKAMRTRLIVAVAFMLGALGYAAVKAETMDEITGKTIQWTNPRGQTYWVTYKADHTLTAKSTPRNGGSGFIYDVGTWSI